MNVKILYKFTIFTISLLLFSHFSDAQNNSQKIKSADYCSLFLNQLTSYESEIVKTRGLLVYSNVPRVDGGDAYFYSQKCNQGDNFAVANFENLKDDNEKWKRFFDDLSEKKIYIFEVDFVGKLKTSIIPSYGHLSWSRNEFEVIEIESIKDVSKTVKKPDFDAETDLTDQGRSLQTISLEAVFFFIGSKSSFKVDEYTGDEFVLTDYQGKKYDKNNYEEFLKNDFFKFENYPSRSVSGGKAKRNGEKFTIVGFIKFSDSQKAEKRFDYENTFILKNGVWILIESKFTMP